MADYIYLLENRLAPAQKTALRTVREVARSKGLTIFLVGGAVRDLTSGSPVRDLDVVVQGNALKLKKELEKAGAFVSGEMESGQALFLRFPGSVRMEFGSTLTMTYPKPGKAVAKPATILEDLRRRDFTANAMALSLNDGSYGLLMDPLNGVADIENRQLRLVSPYGFIEDPVRMIRAARLMARLGWTLDEKTETRYETGKQEGYISAMPEFHRGYELEEIVHEEDPLRVLRRLEAEGWTKHLAPYWTIARVNVPELERMREAQTQLQMQGIQPDAAAANFPLLTAKLSAKEVASLLDSFPRKGFVQEIETLEAEAREFTAQLSGKEAAAPSQAWKLMSAAKPEVVLWTAFSSKSAAVQAKFKSFSGEWPQARQRMPYAMMQEMRIVPELPGYEDLLEMLFFELMDGKLATPEEMKAFLEPFSPPAPPPPVNLRRRVAKKESKPAKSRSKKAVKVEAVEDSSTPLVPATGTEGADAMEAGPPVAAKTPPAESVAVPAKEPARKAASGKTAPAKAAPASVQPIAANPGAKVPATGKAAAKVPAKAAPARSTGGNAAAAGKPGVPAKKSVPVKVPAKKVVVKQVAPAKAAAKKVAAKAPVTPKKAATAVAKKAAKAAPPAKKAPAKIVPAKKQTAGKQAAKAPAKVAGKKAAKRR